MDSFSLIQQYFTQLACQYCHEHFDPDGIELIREQEGFYVVSVSCNDCGKHNGVAMVRVEAADDSDHDEFDHAAGYAGAHGFGASEGKMGKSKSFANAIAKGMKRKKAFPDPELTPKEKKRLSHYEPIGYDDVLDAHAFFSNLDGGWMSLIPSEMLPAETAGQNTGSDTEFPAS